MRKPLPGGSRFTDGKTSLFHSVGDVLVAEVAFNNCSACSEAHRGGGDAFHATKGFLNACAAVVALHSLDFEFFFHHDGVFGCYFEFFNLSLIEFRITLRLENAMSALAQVGVMEKWMPKR